MARGLDALEGEAIEAVGFVILVMVAILIIAAWRGLGGAGSFDPSSIALSILKKLWNAIDSVFSKGVNALSPKLDTGSAQVYSGSTLGTAIPTTPATGDASPGEEVNYNSPSLGGDELSQYDPQFGQ